jgi:hypothetical protein
MSYLVFGMLERASSEVAEIAARHGICLKGTCPDLVHEMLTTGDKSGQQGTAFLLVARESDDTSDSLISPFVLSTDEICRNLRALQDWIQEVTSNTDTGLRLYVTEGFDNSFTRMTIPVTSFRDALCEIIKREGDWPSMIVDVQSLV